MGMSVHVIALHVSFDSASSSTMLLAIDSTHFLIIGMEAYKRVHGTVYKLR